MFRGMCVRFGSNSEVERRSRRVRFTPMNGHRQTGPMIFPRRRRDASVIRCEVGIPKSRSAGIHACRRPRRRRVPSLRPRDVRLTGFTGFSEAPADASNRGRTLLGKVRFARWNAKSQDSHFKDLWEAEGTYYARRRTQQRSCRLNRGRLTCRRRLRRRHRRLLVCFAQQRYSPAMQYISWVLRLSEH